MGFLHFATTRTLSLLHSIKCLLSLFLDQKEVDASFSRGGHSNRLCTNTRDRGQELGQTVKAKNLEGQAHRKLEKVKGQAQLKVNQIQNLIKARYHTL